MSFNVGDSNSKFVQVYDVTMRFSYSEKVLFAALVTSHKTGHMLENKDTGEVILGADGKPKPERVYERWEGRFVGNAFEPAKALTNGQSIDIINGWIEKSEYTGKDKMKRHRFYVVISEFVISEPLDEPEDEVSLVDHSGVPENEGDGEMPF